MTYDRVLGKSAKCKIESGKREFFNIFLFKTVYCGFFSQIICCDSTNFWLFSFIRYFGIGRQKQRVHSHGRYGKRLKKVVVANQGSRTFLILGRCSITEKSTPLFLLTLIRLGGGGSGSPPPSPPVVNRPPFLGGLR